MIKKIVYFILIITFFAYSKFSFAKITINEILPVSSDGKSDWLELYKDESIEIDLTGWKIEDSTGTVWTFPDTVKFATDSSFFIIDAKNRLNNSGDTVRLVDKNGAIIDEKIYSASPGKEISLGRYPDGTDNWGILTLVTKNSANNYFAPTVTIKPTITPPITKEPTRSPTPMPNQTETLIVRKISPISISKFKPKFTTPPITIVLSPQSDNITAVVLGAKDEKDNSTFVLPIILVIAGFALLGVSLYSYLKIKKSPKSNPLP